MQAGKSSQETFKLSEDNPGPEAVFKDRERTNILRTAEQAALYFLVNRTPGFITPNILTGIGMAGSVMVLLGFLLASYVNINYLLLGIVGLAVNWIGDSLDGRIAYFRNIPRKWYGFSLDIIMDWISVALIGAGYIVYSKDIFELFGFTLVVFYGWAMIIAQLRYKITDKYSIDSGVAGPTEIRIVIAFILLLEVLIPGSLDYCIIAICIALFIVNLIDTNKLLDLGDLRDQAEKSSKKKLLDEI
jgi:phosphatidylglycerophosphate synthase